jgi:hypothetical protein
MQACLPNFFSYRAAKDLIRVGREGDGGYLISQADIEKTDFLLGLGIKDDWSFEQQFTSLNKVPVLAYDGSISQAVFLKQLIKSGLRLYNPKRFAHQLRVYFSYRRFFSGPNKHIEKFVGLNTIDERYCSLESILESVKSENIFLKIDIEGAEYRLFETILSQQHRFTGLAIELHHCDLHLPAIESFISRLSLKLVHIHANNNGPVRSDDRLPLVLELSFSAHSKQQEPAKLPHPLDRPCNRKKSEIYLVIQH